MSSWLSFMVFVLTLQFVIVKVGKNWRAESINYFSIPRRKGWSIIDHGSTFIFKYIWNHILISCKWRDFFDEVCWRRMKQIWSFGKFRKWEYALAFSVLIQSCNRPIPFSLKFKVEKERNVYSHFLYYWGSIVFI